MSKRTNKINKRSLRMPDAIADKLAQTAKLNRRSQNEQIVAYVIDGIRRDARRHQQPETPSRAFENGL